MKIHIMENPINPNEPLTALLLIIISGITAAFAWVSIKDVQFIITFFASVVSCVAGVMAVRYYWWATREKKKNLNQ